MTSASFRGSPLPFAPGACAAPGTARHRCLGQAKETRSLADEVRAHGDDDVHGRRVARARGEERRDEGGRHVAAVVRLRTLTEGLTLIYAFVAKQLNELIDDQKQTHARSQAQLTRDLPEPFRSCSRKSPSARSRTTVSLTACPGRRRRASSATLLASARNGAAPCRARSTCQVGSPVEVGLSAKRGKTPASTSEDLPAPELPRTATKRCLSPRSRLIHCSRPQKYAASRGSKGRRLG